MGSGRDLTPFLFRRFAYVCGLTVVILSVSACAGPMLSPINFRFPTAPVEIPRDLAAHEWAQTEWWYYTGHLKSQDGGSYGFELAFFRRRTDLDKFKGLSLNSFSRTGYIAHFSVVDENTGKFLHKGIGTLRKGRARFSFERYDLALDRWKAGGDEKSHYVKAMTKEIAIDLILEPAKSLVKFGDGGVVTKGPGIANYYISYTRMTIAGKLVFEGKDMPVTGVGWFDHEFGFVGSTPMDGWDWFSIQLDNNTEYMIYALRRADGGIEAVNKAYRIDENARVEGIPLSEAEIQVLSKWRSPETKAVYPAGWRIAVPRWNLDVVLVPRVVGQEFHSLGMTYWEGSCAVLGKPANGQAYVELVGYVKGNILRMTKIR